MHKIANSANPALADHRFNAFQDFVNNYSGDLNKVSFGDLVNGFDAWYDSQDLSWVLS